MPSQPMLAFFEMMRSQGLKLTYDDVRLLPLESDVQPVTDTNLHARFSRRVKLKMPIVSSPMDTVTTADMAIAMAKAGGIGIIHRGLSPEDQAREVGRVKNNVHGRIEIPLTVTNDTTVEAVLRWRQEKEWKFHSFPVVDSASKLLGIITRSDFIFCTDASVPVTAVMTPLAELITAGPSIDLSAAYSLMQKNKKKVLPLVAEDGTLAGMYSFSDAKRNLSGTSSHNLDSSGQLVVGAAVGTGEGALQRAELLAAKRCDVFQIDTAHGDSENVFKTVRALKARYPHIDVVPGNVSSGPGAKRLADAGADGILVGQGGGSICTTRVVNGHGVPQVSAVFECVQAVRDMDVPVCADGGINSSGDMVVALAVGAESVMLGRLLAGTEEAPGERQLIGGKLVKVYRGMGSLGAMRSSAASRERYKQGGSAAGKLVPEGVEGVVPYKGPVHSVLDQYTGGIRSGMGSSGVRALSELREVAQLFRITGAGLAESHPHDITITAEAPNYPGRQS